MKIKTFLICWLPTFVIVFGLNGVFHGQLAANFFDSNLNHLAPAIRKMSDVNPLWVALLDFILTFGMTYFICVRQTGKINLINAAFAGGLTNLIASGTWNFINASLFSWPTNVITGDIAWHISLGVVGGFLIGTIYNKLQKIYTR
ncbi:MAG: DUF2177 family protein [Sphingobacteriales bacterium]|jgi:uncharacterized membrane protein|nr:DUF2177 family protein [Sphingobacteriales bacterium]MCC7055983.1 DUF2177 family protein [Chitinophagales bacterium]MDA0197527.1 DUF2177 family protein [Bacteroidota bacterium]MBK6890587.1 DUF2177 family protein [Sphingobacteriales bacterium]MBK7526362.1 DUF2177 family protein [Sphingobacteriales bacterium]